MVDIKAKNGHFKFEGDNFELYQLTNCYGEHSGITQVLHWYDDDREILERAGCCVVPDAWFWSEDFEDSIPESVARTLHNYIQWRRLYEEAHPDWTNDSLIKDLSEVISDAVTMQV